MKDVYGVMSNGVHTDVSSSARGAKRYATLNGYEFVSVRYDGGYNVVILFQRFAGKWCAAVSRMNNGNGYRCLLGSMKKDIQEEEIDQLSFYQRELIKDRENYCRQYASREERLESLKVLMRRDKEMIKEIDERIEDAKV